MGVGSAATFTLGSTLPLVGGAVVPRGCFTRAGAGFARADGAGVSDDVLVLVGGAVVPRGCFTRAGAGFARADGDVSDDVLAFAGGLLGAGGCTRVNRITGSLVTVVLQEEKIII